MPAKLGRIRCTGQCEQLCNQFITLTLRDELRRRNCIRQELKLSQVIGVTIIVLLVLHRLVVFDMKATVMEHGKIIADCVSGNLDGILLFQNLHQLGSREWMFCICMLK